VSLSQAQQWFREAGGMPPGGAVAGSGRYLPLSEREEIALWLAYREIARRLGRPVSTVSPEVARNNTRGRCRYRAVAAQARAKERARWPKPRRRAVNGELRGWVQGTGQPVRRRRGWRSSTGPSLRIRPPGTRD